MIDVLTYMIPDAIFSLENHLESSQPGVNPVYCLLTPGMFWYIKGAAGWPWDGNRYDDQYVYQNVTEADWTDPHNFKAFQSKSWPHAHGGIVWSPRYIADVGEMPSLPIVTGDSSYAVYSNCTAGPTQDLGGPVSTQIEGPFKSVLFGGDLGKLDVLVQSYYWGQTLEVNWYARGYGLVEWQSWVQTGGLYVKQQTAQFNLIKPGGTPALVFPCSIP
jgi:hypothetical protein